MAVVKQDSTVSDEIQDLHAVKIEKDEDYTCLQGVANQGPSECPVVKEEVDDLQVGFNVHRNVHHTKEGPYPNIRLVEKKSNPLCKSRMAVCVLCNARRDQRHLFSFRTRCRNFDEQWINALKPPGVGNDEYRNFLEHCQRPPMLCDTHFSKDCFGPHGNLLPTALPMRNVLPSPHMAHAEGMVKVKEEPEETATGSMARACSPPITPLLRQSVRRVKGAAPTFPSQQNAKNVIKEGRPIHLYRSSCFSENPASTYQIRDANMTTRNVPTYARQMPDASASQIAQITALRTHYERVKLSMHYRNPWLCSTFSSPLYIPEPESRWPKSTVRSILHNRESTDATSLEGGGSLAVRGRRLTRSKDEILAEVQNLPVSVQQIIDMPIDGLRERLGSYSLNQEQLELIRKIRRRGKNKMLQRARRQGRIAQGGIEHCPDSLSLDSSNLDPPSTPPSIDR